MAELVATPAQERAWAAMRGHRHWVYRACAPDPDNPAGAAGDDRVPVTAWLTRDGESQPARAGREQAAVALCARCPLVAACLDYALGDESGPYEMWDVWGGMTARERSVLLRKRYPKPAVVAEQVTSEPVVTDLDLVVLCALAGHHSQHQVAAEAGMTVVRANWHRSRLVTALGLNPRTATRMRLLYAARLAGVLDPRTPMHTDRDRVVAAIPSRQSSVLRARGVQLVLPGMAGYIPTAVPAGTRPRLRLVPDASAGAADVLEMVA